MSGFSHAVHAGKYPSLRSNERFRQYRNLLTFSRGTWKLNTRCLIAEKGTARKIAPGFTLSRNTKGVLAGRRPMSTRKLALAG